MSPDLESLLAAVVANPGDDTARLAYADCLQEHGNEPRAAFIRLQVEAERLHPYSNARAALEARAQALFKRHWVEWWGEVCAAVGLPTGGPPGYRAAGGAALVPRRSPGDGALPRDQCPITFRRGFPEAVSVPALAAGPGPCGSYLARWAAVSPLTELVAVGAAREPRYQWPEGEHLRTVRRLQIRQHSVDTLRAARDSPHLGALEHLTLHASWAIQPAVVAGSLAFEVAAAHAPRLRHLSAPIRPNRVAEMFARAEPFAALESLDLELFSPPWYESDQAEPLRTFVESRHVSGVRRLAFHMLDNSDDLAPLLQSRAWGRLRALDIDFGNARNRFGVLRRGNDLTGLKELRLAGVYLTAEAVRDLAAAPLLKRVKHFALFGAYENGRALLPLVDAVDPDRIETFAIGVSHFPERAANALRAKFGDRVRFLES
ncbi:hypothetical protein GobsT_05520 [Gemmata obscuriglobus]|uniref:TIGR02996 domain-containing protein n=1 Tax=Gemmata obscuriglobus TaxID=114 RepID=UPI00016C58BD|nr:TIGR02996 domain-containing protein [Gemmata obscuriglobus]QEG25817.1 hypothetical protein GobsT_05520 [Gemmata obscuriglobus]VTR99730.1 unnamed protein product [Gemmata obscuriglobus UQM 2246]